MTRKILIACLQLFFAQMLFAQPGQVRIYGRITESPSGEPVPFATVAAPEVQRGTTADENGAFEILLPAGTRALRFTSVGFEEKTVTLGPGATQQINVQMSSSETILREVTIKPAKYRNKDNPSVDLIRKVIEHRDQNRLGNLDYYQEQQYEKIMLGISKMPDNLADNKLLKGMRVVLENRDTSKLEGQTVIPIMLQENVIDLYSKHPPGIQRRYIRANQSVEAPNYLDPAGVNKTLQYLYQTVDLYNNHVVLLTDHFVSPIANNAPFFYRYYARDTLVRNGVPIVRIEFYPRNKTDMLLQGELFVTLDSAYALTRAVFGVNPNVNLNWVRRMALEQDFGQLPSGKWYLFSEGYRMDFGITRNTIGLYGERTLLHRYPVAGVPIPDSLFAAPDAITTLANARVTDTLFWASARPESLSDAEASTYARMDSLQRTRLFKTAASLMNVALAGFLPVGKHLEMGPVATFYSFNDVEGQRFRHGYRTSTAFSKTVRLRFLAGYGTDDRQWKFNTGGDVALGGSHHTKFPLNLIRARYVKDLVVPGLQLYQNGSNTFLTSFVRGVNDKFLYTDRVTLEHEREFSNHFSFILGTEREEMRPAGVLRFDPSDTGTPLDQPLTTSRFFVHLRYAPGEKFFQSASFRQLIDYRWILQSRYTLGLNGVYGGDYNFQQASLSVRKFSNTPPFGYNTVYLEASSIFGQVPWPLLSIHRANQSYIYDQFSYNMMNFMEFISDRYLAFNVDHSFYGFFLNKIPVLRRLKLREFATVKFLYGTVTERNRPSEGSGLFYFPTNADGSPTSYVLSGQPYVEASIGIGNIFKVLRIDLVRRFTYLDHPGAPTLGLRVKLDAAF
jgi:hypothetical protein